MNRPATLRRLMRPFAALPIVALSAALVSLSADGAPSSAVSTAPSAADAAPPAAPSTAAEVGLKKTLETRFNATVDSLTKLPMGLYEVHVGEDVFYTDPTGSYLIVGNLVDLRTRENLTRKSVEAIKQASMPPFKFTELPFDTAVKVVRGNGRRQVAIFEDPNCGYCRKLESSLDRISDVTIWVFLYPVLGPDSLAKSKQVWCASNRSKAWTEWMGDNRTALAGEGACETPLDRTLELGKKLRVDGTPTMFFSNNKRVEGAIDQGELEKLLSAG